VYLYVVHILTEETAVNTGTVVHGWFLLQRQRAGLRLPAAGQAEEGQKPEVSQKQPGEAAHQDCVPVPLQQQLQAAHRGIIVQASELQYWLA
jgi:hypothetical protein